MQLPQAESAFPTGKSEFWLRRAFHRKTQGVEVRILVGFLALALWQTLGLSVNEMDPPRADLKGEGGRPSQMWMRGKGVGTCARPLLKEVTTVRSMDVILAVKNRGEVRMRVVTKPDRPEAELRHRLGDLLPRTSTVRRCQRRCPVGTR